MSLEVGCRDRKSPPRLSSFCNIRVPIRSVSQTFAALTMAGLLSSCDAPPQGDQNSASQTAEPERFTSKELVANGNRLPSQFTKSPVFIKLPDNTLMCVAQGASGISFYRTFGGYGQGSFEVNALPYSANVSYMEGNIYIKILPEEAIEYAGNKFSNIYNPVKAQYQQSRDSVDPDLLRASLGSIILPPVFHRAHGDPIIGLLEFKKVRYGLTIDDFTANARAHGTNFVSPYFNWEMQKALTEAPRSPTYDNTSDPVFILISGGELMKIVQVTKAGPQGNLAYFYISKTSTGYATSGGKGSIAGFGMGSEKATSNVYTPITPKEALAYIDEDKILERVRAQADVNWNAVEPEVLEQYFGMVKAGKIL